MSNNPTTGEWTVETGHAAADAERKGHEMDGQLISSQEVEIQQLREQLAASVEVVNAARNARSIPNGLLALGEAVAKFDAALAKIGEK